MIKPIRWAPVSRGLVAPEWQELWDALEIALIQWEGVGVPRNYGKYQVPGATVTDTAWATSPEGLAMRGDGTATGDGIDLNDSLVSIMSAGTGSFSVVARVRFNDYTPAANRGIMGIRGDASTRGWLFQLLTTGVLRFSLFGTAAYDSGNAVSVNGPTDGGFATLGISVIIGVSVTFYVNGLTLDTSPTVIASGIGQTLPHMGIWCWADWNTDDRLEIEIDGDGLALYAYSRALNAREHYRLHQDFYGLLRMRLPAIARSPVAVAARRIFVVS